MKRNAGRIVVTAICACLFAVCFLGCGCGEKFNGKCEKDENGIYLDFEVLNKTITHVLTMNNGDEFTVGFDVKSGNVRLKILSADNDVVYSGNGEEVKNFSVKVNRDGEYRVEIKGENAKGTISVKAGRK